MRMKRVLVVLVIAFAIAESPVCAQYMINGIVRDAVTNERLEGVNIFFDKSPNPLHSKLYPI